MGEKAIQGIIKTFVLKAYCIYLVYDRKHERFIVVDVFV